MKKKITHLENIIKISNFDPRHPIAWGQADNLHCWMRKKTAFQLKSVMDQYNSF
jgi:hypothetical protein